MDAVVQQMVNALSLGGTYALLALGLAVVFSVVGFVNFAHGELMTVTGYTMMFLSVRGLPFGIVVLGGTLAAVLAALLMERIAFRPLRGASITSMLLTSFAISLVIQLAFTNLVSPLPRSVPVPDSLLRVIEIGSLQIGRIQLVSIVATAASLGCLVWFLRRTSLGIAVRAAAEDFSTTRLMGVPANRVLALTFVLSGFLAGVAGVLWVAQRGSTSPDLGFVPVIKAFIAAIIGGLGSLSGAVMGGLALGAIEVLLQSTLPDSLLSFRDAFALGLVILVLTYRPAGLFGKPSLARI